LVDGEKVFMDASLIDADASNNSVINTGALKRYLNEGYQELERRLDEANVAERSGANGGIFPLPIPMHLLSGMREVNQSSDTKRTGLSMLFTKSSPR
jgi:hypothetical protein